MTFYLTFDAERAPDSYGRRSFMLDWKDSEGRPRGQCFFTNPEAYKADAEKRGYKVVVGPAPWRRQ